MGNKKSNHDASEGADTKEDGRWSGHTINDDVCDISGKAHHIHVDEHGILHRCYHKCRGVVTSFGFWVGLTLGFPVEHYLWEKVWPFTLITKWLGL
jgi:hypothetical protein